MTSFTCRLKGSLIFLSNEALMTNRYYFLLRSFPGALFAAVLVFFAVSPLNLSAQDVERIENPFSSVFVTKDQKSGKFWFASGAQHGYTRYLYRGAGISTTVTSHVVFRVTRGDQVLYFCNTPENFSNGGVRPQGPQGNIPFLPYDSMYISPARDTLEVIWKKVDNLYRITMRFVAEQPRHQYDNGADILLEFDYQQVGSAPSGADLGIFLMLDGDNGTITTGDGSDKSSVLTDRGYYSTQEFGQNFQKNFGGIPEYYMTGWFEYTNPLNTIFSIHRLSGTSLRGAPLTTPNTFAIGNWKDFRSLSWNFNADLTSKQIADMATAMRWESLGSEGIVRTAFGTTSNEGNNLYHCRDSNVFVAIRTQRVVTQAQINGPYSPAQFDIEMWVSSLKRQIDVAPMFELETPIQSFPSGSGRVTLDPSTPARVSFGIRPRETKKITWRVTVDQSSNDSLVAFRILYRDTASLQSKPLVPLREGCMPLVNFKGAYTPPPPDTRPPVVQATGSGRDAIVWWGFRAFDRHTDFNYDSGLDRVEILRNDGNNFRLLVSPDPFRRCDTTETISIRAEIIDTTKPGNISFRVHDCEGNTSDASAGYTPRPDVFAPQIVRIDSLERFDPMNYPCAVQTYQVFLDDQQNQTPTAGDAGFGTIEVLSSANFDPIQINFDRGDVPVADFDKVASFRLHVTDRLVDAEAVVRVADYAGNADTLTLRYCTLPDVEPPVVVSTPVVGDPVRSWDVSAGDKGEWDRGLAEVVVISSMNMVVNPWPVVIAPGQPDVSGVTVSVIDDAWDGELTLEFRDTYYDENDPSTYAAHSRRVQFTFDGIDDTLAPNIIYRRDLTVPATEVVFTVQVNDTHYVGAELYRYDRGLEGVTWSLTPNMRLRSPLVYTDNRRGAEFQVEIIDPLAIVEGDTVCVEAIDSAGNRRGLCNAWPSTPDGKSPLFIGSLDAGRTRITGVVTDNRESDRGLGSVVLRNGVNLRPYSQLGIGGLPSVNVELQVIDPLQPISGELVIRDLVGEMEGGVEQSIHTVVLPFSLGVGSVEVELPELVEGGEDIDGIIRAGEELSGSEVEVLKFGLRYSGSGSYVGSSWGSSVKGVRVVPGMGGELRVELETMANREYSAGEELGRLRFTSERPFWVETFDMELTGGVEVNGGAERVIEVRTAGDPDASTLRLPGPYVKVVSDSQTVVNGECNRVLGGDGSMSRPVGLSIIGVYPQPVVGGGESVLRLYVRDVPDQGAELSLVSLDGTEVQRVMVEGSETDELGQVELPLPGTLSSGIYILRLRGSTGTDQVKILINR